MGKRKTTEQFISEAIKVHGDKYDYSKVEYKACDANVLIICPKHGEFLQTPSSHLSGRGCNHCGREQTIKSVTYDTKSFIEKAIKKHGEKFDYSKVEYVDYNTKVCIICPIHGEFWQKPTLHLTRSGCFHCNTSKVRRTNLYGIATVDVIDAHCPENRKAYTIWQDMLSRCYNPAMLDRFPTYKDVSVCKEWHTFSNFKKWFDENFIEGYDLDKDLLVKGNKIYSPETCCFTPHKINCTINRCQRSRGSLPIGVHYDKSRDKYHSALKCGMATKFIGRFNTPLEAFNAYKIAKENYIKELAEKYFQEGKITEKVYNALMKYEVEITD